MWLGTSPDRAFQTVSGFLKAVRRYGVALVVWNVACIGVALALIATTKPEYIASTQLLLQSGHAAQDGPEVARQFYQMVLDGRQMQTELGVIRSQRLLRYVFDTLGSAEAITGFERNNALGGAYKAFADRVSARRVGLSYVVEIGYRTSNPAEAARVVNAIAAAYLHDRVTSAVADALENTPYLRSRIASIMYEVRRAADAVQTGVIPAEEFPDADARLLGPAVEPPRAYPRPGPILIFALGFSLVTGLLAIATLHHLDRRIRSRQQLLDLFPIACLTLKVGRSAEAQVAGLQAVWQIIRRASSVGVLAWRGLPACQTVALGLTGVLRSAGAAPVVVDLHDRAEREAAALAGLVESHSQATPLVLLMPALHGSPEGQCLSPLMDAIVLVVQAHRSTIDEVRAAIQALTVADARLAAMILVEA